MNMGMNAESEAKVGDEQDRWLRRRGLQVRLAGLSCIAFLTYPIVGLLDQNILLFLPLAGFALGYARVIWRNTPWLHANRAPLTIVVTLACGSLLIPTLRFEWLSGMAFFASVMLLINYSPRAWRLIVAGTTIGVVAIGGAILRTDVEWLLPQALIVLVASGVQVGIYKHIGTSMELHEARIELAQLAVAEERLRIARDLHDILGQRLSTIALKAEVATRLVAEAPDRATIEMTEVSAMAREGLTEARAAVSGYRNISLVGEAQAAEALLKASGFEVSVRVLDEDIPKPVEECAAWIVREATTNVVRHARASRCEIEVARSGDSVVVEVRDDGVGVKLADPPVYGNGLTGLAERTAIVNGQFDAGLRDGWFVVRASLPAAPYTG